MGLSYNFNFNVGKKHLLAFYLFPIVLFISVLPSCRKFIDVNPPATSLTQANVFTNDATAAAVLTGIYTQIANLNLPLTSNSLTGISYYTALYSDELTLHDLNNSSYYPWYSNNLISSVTSGLFWNNFYGIIYLCNSALEGLANSNTLTPAIKQQLEGEAKFMRSLCYFYLVNLYGNVPFVSSTDYKINASPSRTDINIIYQTIISDLNDAAALLSANYLQSDAFTPYPNSLIQRVRPNKWAAIALLSRIYLYIGNYTNADTQSSLIINNSSLYSLPILSNVFKMNSTETIWAIQPVKTGTASNTGEGSLFILPAAGPNNTPNNVYLTNSLYNSFESSDQRKSIWIGSVSANSKTYYYPFKYKIGSLSTSTSEYSIILRLAEQILIRAEARAQLNNISGAQADLNLIRSRAGLTNTTANTQLTLLNAILHERQVELFTELGHRWFDLKRTGSVDAIMSGASILKGGTWSTYKSLFPIPLSELSANFNLIQNVGY